MFIDAPRKNIQLIKFDENIEYFSIESTKYLFTNIL